MENLDTIQLFKSVSHIITGLLELKKELFNKIVQTTAMFGELNWPFLTELDKIQTIILFRNKHPELDLKTAKKIIEAGLISNEELVG